jgi:hypothetical protein
VFASEGRSATESLATATLTPLEADPLASRYDCRTRAMQKVRRQAVYELWRSRHPKLEEVSSCGSADNNRTVLLDTLFVNIPHPSDQMLRMTQ